MKILIAIIVASSIASADPLPGEESGRIDEPSDKESAGRKLGRGLLFIPKTAVQIVFAPVRLGVWAANRYHLRERAHRLFFNDANTFGVYPTLRYDSNYGLRFGAQTVLATSKEDRFRGFAGASIDGDLKRFDGAYSHTEEDSDVTVGAMYEHLPRRHNYAIGNVDSGKSLYDSKLTRVAARGGHQLDAGFELRGAMSLARREAMGEYDVGYIEAEALWDSRRGEVGWDTPTVMSRGSLVSLWSGHSTILDGRDFWRFGGDAQHNLRLGDGPRVLSLRLHGEAIDADVDEVPVTELPSLGGPLFLRGYPIDRFRDKIALVGTAEYQWDLSRYLFASLFVDTGRVYDDFDDLEIADLRTGYGAALELHTPGLHGLRGSVASSTDGGVEFNLYLEPVFDLPPRVERR
jgi:hypothetical protein